MDPTKGSYYVDLTVVNGTLHNVNNIILDQLSFETSAGTGKISYNTAVAPPLPLTVGNLAPGTSAVVRVYLKSTTAFGRGGVQRFNMTENLRMMDNSGTLFSTPYTESINP
jgi:hypothetical protein